jgi:hypothetical protein
VEVPPWIAKNGPFVALGVLFVFFAWQLSRAGGCATPTNAPTEENWPKQKPPPKPK